ncbi:MAG: zinc-ribbon domain-containing protein [Eubacterium sp.]
MAELYCRNCGQPLRDTDNFCPKCGTRVEREKAAETAAAGGNQPAGHPQNERKEQNAAPAAQEIRGHEADDRRSAGAVSGEEEIRKNREAFHIDDFDWGNSDYPSGHPHKTEDVNFNWHTAPAAAGNDTDKTVVIDRSALKEAQADKDDSRAADNDSGEDRKEELPSGEPAGAVSERAERDLDAIDTFYTYSQKNEEFQQVLNKEYDRIRRETPSVPASASLEERLAEKHAGEEQDASPEETLHKLEELAKKAQSVTEASSRAAEAASEMYGEEEKNTPEENAETDGSRPEENLRHDAARVQDLLDRQEEQKQPDQQTAEKKDPAGAEHAQDASAEPEHAGGAAEPASSTAEMNYVFNPEKEAAKKKKKKRHIGLKIFVTIVILLIIVEAGFLILRKVAPDSAVCVQMEKVFMNIADLIYRQFG